MEIAKIYENEIIKQMILLYDVKNIVLNSGNVNGLSQWHDRIRLHKLTNTIRVKERLLTQNDYQFLEMLVLKYNINTYI